LRTDARVTVLERINARHLRPDQLSGPFDIVTVDVSFISLRLVLPVVPPLLAPGADVIVLVKPQFEAGREEVGRRGVIDDPAVQQRVVRDVSLRAAEIGLDTVAMTPSPITGAEGNQEFLLHLRERLG
jgi:23S rRNA (cytidine1920-2'-O)/16S rRNA (cytidine1409-2'-O)-methyltransferase